MLDWLQCVKKVYEWWNLASVQCKCIIHECHVYSSRPALFNSDVVNPFTQVCWRPHNATLSHSKCFSIGICSLSHKMESQGGLGIWKGHIWGPPLWVFTFKDKWSHWIPASCEWAPSAHTGFLNAHQNNLSKPRNTFLRHLMWGQIGNHFNKIPLRWNCISQESKTKVKLREYQRMEVYLFLRTVTERGFIVLTDLQWTYMQLSTKTWLGDRWGCRYISKRWSVSPPQRRIHSSNLCKM